MAGLGPLACPTRRDLLREGLGLVAAVACPAVVGRASAGTRAWANGDPFSLGVASGCPTPDGFVLWTRLAPEPLSADPHTPGGMRGPDVSIGYEIATDANFSAIVRKGDVRAEANFAYSVHLEVKGLEPQRWYWYRFLSGAAHSHKGRVMTAPREGENLDKLKFGAVSCASYEKGFYAAYRHLANEHPDVVLFLGDYVYEFSDPRGPSVRNLADGGEAVDLRTYRNRYAQYRTDPDLQHLHARAAALVTWDDHEVSNDYAGRWSQNFEDPEAFLSRRLAAYRAFYEHMPLKPSLSTPIATSMRIYDKFTFGDLAQIFMLDGRQYRSKPACYNKELKKSRGRLESNESCPERLEEARTLLGGEQEAWLYEGLSTSKARWNILGQSVMVAELHQRLPGGVFGYWTDDWNGYPAARARLLRSLHTHKVSNPIVLAGDFHAFVASDLKLDSADPASPTVATEFVCTSVTSPAGMTNERFAQYRADNPHIRFFDASARGYAFFELAKERALVHFRQISDPTDPHATVSTLKTFIVDDGTPGLKPA